MIDRFLVGITVCIAVLCSVAFGIQTERLNASAGCNITADDQAAIDHAGGKQQTAGSDGKPDGGSITISTPKYGNCTPGRIARFTVLSTTTDKDGKQIDARTETFALMLDDKDRVVGQPQPVN